MTYNKRKTEAMATKRTGAPIPIVYVKSYDQLMKLNAQEIITLMGDDFSNLDHLNESEGYKWAVSSIDEGINYNREYGDTIHEAMVKLYLNLYTNE